MTGCLGRTPNRTEPTATRLVTEREHSDQASSEESFGDRVENLQPYNLDPNRMVEKMNSGMTKPKHMSNKCILV